MVVIALAAWASVTLGAMAWCARLAPSLRGVADRACAALLLAMLEITAMVRLLGALALLRPAVVWVGTVALAALPWITVRRADRAVVRADLSRLAALVRESLRGMHVVGVAIGAVVFVLAAWAAGLLRPWSWDGLGYHLPVVYDALQEHRLRVVPTSVLFVNAYPHAGEYFFIAWRAWLPDDTWIDFAQAPFAIMAVSAVAALARRGGASPGRALGMAALFLAVPVVALQLASNYVDIAFAALLLLATYFATATLTPGVFVSAAMAVALLLAVKPSAPPAAALVLAVLAWRGAKAKLPVGVFAAAAIVLACGCESYIANVWAHHNPVWPVQMRVGPWTLPGLAPARLYLDAGLPDAFAGHGWLGRLLVSWFSFPARHVYDMRIGGLGPLFAFGLLPLAGVLAARKATRVAMLPALLAGVATLATPGAFLARYTLALPAALLAWIVAASQPWRPRRRHALDLVLAALAIAGFARAVPAFTDGGPSLLAVQRMSPAARVDVASIDLLGRAWADALARVSPGAAVGFESPFELSGLLWRGDGRTRVVFRDRAPTTLANLDAWIARERIEAAVLCDDASGRLARDHTERFEPVFRCRFEPCTLYRVRPAGSVATARAHVLVVAPHPDDEVLIAAGVIRRALDRGDAVDVVIMTNGDYTCERNGYVREAESVAALASLGLAEDKLHFLGYPDGHLSHLGAMPLGPVERRDATGACVRASGTYGARGERRHDEHHARAGEPGAYTAASITDDLAAIVQRVRPTDVYVTHAIDDHPDHAATYMFLRRALERASGVLPVTVHRAVVHAGPCWPNGSGRSEPCPPAVLDPRAPMPPLPDPLTAYAPRERLALPASLLAGQPSASGKFLAIATYVSQTGLDPARDWLATFARADEVFYPEHLVLDAVRGRIDRAVGPGSAPMECVFTAGPTSDAAAWTVRFLAEGTGSGAGDEIASDGPGGLRMSVRSDVGDARVLRRVPLPEDPPGTTHRYEVRFDPRADDGGVVEITLRRDGEFLAVAVDPFGGRVRCP